MATPGVSRTRVEAPSPAPVDRGRALRSREAIWTFDRSGRVTWGNRFAKLIEAGARPPETYRDLVEPDELGLAEQVVADALSGRMRVDRLRLRSGFDARLSTTPLLDPTGVAGFVWFAHDAADPGAISLYHGCEEAELQRRIEELESQLVDSQGNAGDGCEPRPEEVARLAMVSHDLRTPLSGILAQAELLRVRAEKLGVDWCLQGAEAVIRVGKHMQTMIADLVEATSLEAGEVDLVRSEFAPQQLLAELIEIFPIDQRSRLHVEVDAGLPALHADRQRLLRALTNLVANALKYSPAETPVLVRARSTQRGLVIAIEDRGVGIEPDALAHVFEPFFREADSAPDGLGLGLHIARLLVEAHGGEIAVASQKRCGTTFEVHLPAELTD